MTEGGPTIALLRRGSTRLAGALLIVAAVLLNRRYLGAGFAPDGAISSSSARLVILGFQGILAAIGAWLLLRRTRPFPPLARRAAEGFALLAVLCGIYGGLRYHRLIDPDRELRAAWKRMEASEETILRLTPHLASLSRSVLNLVLPDERARSLFAPRVQFLDRASPRTPLEAGALVARFVERVEGVVKEVDREDLDLWRSLFDDVAYFRHAKFKFVRGRFADDDPNRFVSDLAFDALARSADGWRTIRATVGVEWTKTSDSDDESVPGFAIARWVLRDIERLDSPRLLFDEVLDSALEPEALVSARRSIHEELVLRAFTDESFERPHEHFYVKSQDRHPGLAVVDVEPDGDDDIYVLARWGANQFFRNDGDGTFTECAAAIGLAIRDHCSSAIFGDFDNDGDPDAIIGRTLAPSQYLENDGGRFIERSGRVAGRLPHLVSSISTVDYDGDGLLDVYLSTYAALIGQSAAGGSAAFAAFLDEEDERQLYRLIHEKGDWQPVLNDYGPPNVLLRNAGDGRFEVMRESPLHLFRQSYQSTWADYDEDGDADVYIANDFGPNNLFRNDGSGAFVDVTAETGTADTGFGMGVSWGDYDRDGRLDLYVTNMYSKAGRRIVPQLAGIDPRFQLTMRGNSLFRNRPDGRFDKVSGDPPALTVERAGWGWGSQFVDVDADADLDIYALAGYYTAPRDVEIPRDL